MSSFFSWILNYCSDLLKLLGLMSSVKGKIIFLGLDNAGKTTLLHKLKSNLIGAYQSTTTPNKESIEISSTCSVEAIDMGGHDLARQLWKQYCIDVNGIVFIVDSMDRKRSQVAAKELAKILNDSDLANVPVVILGNKVDNPQAMSEFELCCTMGVSHLRTGPTKGINESNPQRPLEVFMTSIINEFNITESIEWLVSKIK
ncbi:ARF/SAR family small GTPase [Naegleria gruberi]|uniref:ARF/SAR family small GTPase n=1 Tax=Naegleria gruberi TaxID=5762 RepID=D2W6C2_NAEGR|nr:ARF/SAR family small GTPase [Naegleria gruberi]EFC35380.1 ARF/SAR family small GTPase [Naegleria gruberi]|eukprot:XP_002668124.1 ARF/SAR family small GTPase [Naegleria gruberi strain NEG-M]